MVYRFLLLLFALLRTQIRAAECPLITGTELGSMTRQSESGLIASSLSGNAMTPVAVHLIEYSIVCLSSGRSEDRYRFASVVVNYSCEGSDLCPANNTSVLSQIHCECEEDGQGGEGEWVMGVFGDDEYAVQTPPDADLSTELKTDCATCAHPEQTLSREYARLRFDNETHCAFCDQQCQQTGLGTCFGPTDSDCFGTEQGGNGFSAVWAIVILAILGCLVLAVVCILLIFWGVNCRLYKSRGNYPVASTSLEDVSIELKHIGRDPESSQTTNNQQKNSFNVPGPNDVVDLSHLLYSPEVPLPSPDSLGISPYAQHSHTTHSYTPHVPVYPSAQPNGFPSTGRTHTDRSLSDNSAASPDIDEPTPCSQDQASMAGQYTGTPL